MTRAVPDGFEAVSEWLQHAPTVETVYGDPVERDDRTVLPVARVRYGVAGGFGWGEDGDEEAEQRGGGGGGAGGAGVSPVGALEVTDEGVEFVRFERGGSERPRLRWLGLGVALGVLLARRLSGE